ncbi:hypothetical protein [Limnohabitans sp. B9-3]|uniref:hypothetical protein n=1 Tax=Limnohabitans sp. B9-3 TaxID=1100707 RepID=UPI001E2DB559|nr:hypothetical protein [Limnohabitans sp. B9-3]
MKTKLIKFVAILGLIAANTVVQAQDIQERTIKLGHLNNTDHPTSMGVKKFAEIVAAKSGGKIKVTEFASRGCPEFCVNGASVNSSASFPQTGS